MLSSLRNRADMITEEISRVSAPPPPKGLFLMFWIDSDRLKLDECDGEPVCADCGESLESFVDTEKTIGVCCTASECPAYGNLIIRASSYEEITRYLLSIYHGDLR